MNFKNPPIFTILQGPSGRETVPWNYENHRLSRTSSHQVTALIGKASSAREILAQRCESSHWDLKNDAWYHFPLGKRKFTLEWTE